MSKQNKLMMFARTGKFSTKRTTLLYVVNLVPFADHFPTQSCTIKKKHEIEEEREREREKRDSRQMPNKLSLGSVH